jgi:pyridoxamine 5'-phosphate oxidase
MKSTLKDIEQLRRDYSGEELNESNVERDPLRQFQRWMEGALNAGVLDPHAMTLATVSAEGKPSARIVLLRAISEGEFTFYTNYESRKGGEVAGNPNVALVFFWLELDRQIRVEGQISTVGEAESDRYFASRPRGSQIAAWASKQSGVISGREELERKFREMEARFSGKLVPRPENWGGMKVRANKIEFWQGRPSRLHDRILYTLQSDGSWAISRLAP